MINQLSPVNLNPATETKCGEIFYNNVNDFTLFCRICQIRFSRFDDFTFHMQNIHSKNFQHTIDEVLDPIGSESNLENSKNTNTNVKSNEEAKPKEMLKLKKLNTNTAKKIKKPCPTGEFPCTNASCNKTFTLRRNLTRHLHVHKLERKFKCKHENCGKDFTTRRRLSAHVYQMHTHGKNFACDSCPYKCRSSATLEEHKRTHTDERPYTCEVCKKSYKSKCSLKAHSLVHTTQEHKCTYCQEVFHEYMTYKKHLSTHFKCKFCDIEFEHSEILDMHIKYTHTEHRASVINF